jgi:nucleotide-binding universal stress UspA family protein
MPGSILVGYDPRAADHAPVDFGIAASRLTGARLIVMSVEEHHGLAGQVDPDLMADARQPVELIDAKLRAANVPYESRRVQSTSAARALQETAEQEDAALVVIGSSRRSGAGRVLAGGTGVRLLHGAPCPVAVAPQGWTAGGRLGQIGVAYVDSEEGRAALRAAHELARRTGGLLRVFTVARLTPSMHLDADAVRHSWEPDVKDVTDVAGEKRVEAEAHLLNVVSAPGGDVPVQVDAFIGDPADEIVRLSAQFDLLVCGSRGYGPLRAVLLGSVSRRVMEESQCPAVVLPRGVDAPFDALLADRPGAAAAA